MASRFQIYRILFILCCKIIVNGEDDYYVILGLSRNANSKEIRQAYRRLAREWHPDKNTGYDAQEKFMKINEAYETLSDSKKRNDYDRYGQSGPPRHNNEQFFTDDGFMFFSGMPFFNNFHYQQYTTLNYYKKTILPESYRKLYLLQIVADFCIKCEASEAIWEDTARYLKNQGVATQIVNRNFDPQLARLLGVRRLPDFVAVISGKLYHYSGPINVDSLKQFVHGLFPKDLVIEITDVNSKQFLNNWYEKNKPRAVLFTNKHEAPLLLKVVAFRYRQCISLGYVKVSNSESKEILVRFGVESLELPAFMVFKEDTSKPDILLQASDLQTGSLEDTISYNLYLNFPRLSSQEIFEELCPAERFVSKRSLCVVLFTNVAPDIRHSFPGMSKEKSWRTKGIRFVYVNSDVQQNFETSLKMDETTNSVCKNTLTSKKVAILWRVKDREVKYTWFENGWCGPRDVARLSDVLNNIRVGEIKLERNAIAAELRNEHAKNILAQVFDFLNTMSYYCVHYIDWSGHLPTVCMVITVIVIFLMGWLFPSKTESNATKCGETADSTAHDCIYGIIQLNPRTQKRLISSAPEGQLLLLLLSDAASNNEALRSPVVKTFAEITSFFKKDHIFTFAWLSIPQHIAWCNEVMKIQEFGEVSAGTVLAINGARKYLSVFKIVRSPQEQHAGSVFEDSEEEDSDSSTMVFREDKRTQKRTADKLARQFPRWIEKLLQGMVPRIKVDSRWPKLECDQ